MSPSRIIRALWISSTPIRSTSGRVARCRAEWRCELLVIRLARRKGTRLGGYRGALGRAVRPPA